MVPIFHPTDGPHDTFLIRLGRLWVPDPAALYRANLAFRAVLVPPGRHTVTFRYEPRSLRVAFAVSALAACLIVGMLMRPRNGRPPASGAPAVPGGSPAAR